MSIVLLVEDNASSQSLMEDVFTFDRVPARLVTVNNGEEVSVCLDDGAVDHIGKPFSSMVLRSRVRAVLRSCVPVADARPAAEQK